MKGGAFSALVLRARDRYSIGKMLFSHYSEQHFSTVPFLPRYKIGSPALSPKGYILEEQNFTVQDR